MGEDHNDLELVRRVQAGERNAFDLLVRKYQYRIAALVRRYVRDEGKPRTWCRKASSAPGALCRNSAVTPSSTRGSTGSP